MFMSMSDSYAGTLSSDGVWLGGEALGLDVAVRVEASWMELMPLQQSLESSLPLLALQQVKIWGGVAVCNLQGFSSELDHADPWILAFQASEL